MMDYAGIPAPDADDLEMDAIVIGAGFAGLYAVHRLHSMGLSVLGIEKAIGVGGVWYWNRYPGARCDIPSLEYSYSFSEELQQEWSWKERYAAQPEILDYLNHVADRFDLRRHFRFSTTVKAASWDSADARWTVDLEAGGQCRCKYLILAVGGLSTPKAVDFPTLDTFEGPVYHTSHWPQQEVDFAGRRVAVLGTGSSGLQTITTIAKSVGQLYVLQRTPPFSVPAWNRPTDPDEEKAYKSRYREMRDKARSTSSGFAVDETSLLALSSSEDQRRERFEKSWQVGGLPFGGAFADLLVSQEANDLAADFLRAKIASIVEDPDTARRLLPTSYPFGAKRMCVDTGYFEVFNQDNVELVDIARDGVEFTRDAIRVGDRDLPVDAVIMATGFDAITGSILKIRISADGESLSDAWAQGPQTLLGVMTAGFPNLFLVTGPASPSVLSNMVVSIEQHVDWIAETLDHMERGGIAAIAAQPQAQREWMAHVAEIADATLFPRADSWYVGANIPGKPRQFMVYLGGVKAYADKCAEIIREGYPGFDFTPIATVSDVDRSEQRA